LFKQRSFVGVENQINLFRGNQCLMVPKEKWHAYVFVCVQMTTEGNEAPIPEKFSAKRIFNV
jgi:hypothetical protein